MADADYDALHEGVPAWLKGTVLDWMRPVFLSGNPYGSPVVRVDRLREAERRLREIELGIGSDSALFGSFFQQAVAGDDLLLDALDLAVSFERLDGFDYEVTERLVDLESALEQAGSAWRVANYPEGYCCLERRVDESTTAAAREVMSTAERAGLHLAAAWTRSYGRTPSPSESYREAVRSVEVAAIRVVIPNDPSPTLGKVIPALRSAPHKWRVTLTPFLLKVRSRKVTEAFAVTRALAAGTHP